MNTLLNILTENVSSAFKKCGYDKNYGKVIVSDRQDLCEFQCNGAFMAAKQYRKAPQAIATEVAAVLTNEMIFKKVEVVSGFLNLEIEDRFLLNYINELAEDKHLGIQQAEKQETIVVDYGGPNCAKPLHIGHLRAAIIGEALKRLAAATGRNAIGDVHLGDWGLPMGLVIAEIKARHPELPYFKDDYDDSQKVDFVVTAEELNEIYPFASKKSKEDEEFRAAAQKITVDLQNLHKGYYALWKKMLQVSKDDFKKMYDTLNVQFELWYGESDADQYIDELLKILDDKNLTYTSNGALVVDVQNEDDKVQIPPVMIKKSDNSSNYATTDLATILQRQKDYKPNEIWYVVDSRQSLHFNQVFRCAKKAEIVSNDTNLEHLGFGTMNGKDGKPFKTRDGGVMKLEDLYNTVYEKAVERLKESEFGNIENIEEKASKITVAAIKFGDLINHRLKDYIFDIDKFLASKGKTGVFLLYTIARINSLLSKLEQDENSKITISNIYSDTEKQLLLKLSLSGEVFKNSFNEKAPNYICENAYEIASLFSNFYNDNHIISESDADKKQVWVNICQIVKKMLIKHLDILGIEHVNAM